MATGSESTFSTATADQRAQVQADILAQQKTADTQITNTDEQHTQTIMVQNQEVTDRTSFGIPANGLHPGRKRSITEDGLNQIDLRSIEAAQISLSRDQSNNIVVTQRQIDSTRARQKLQMRCNHQFDTTRRCIYCSKLRDSHRFDP